MNPEAAARWSAARPGGSQAVDAACLAPWVSLEFDPHGWVYTCCANQTYPLGRIGDVRLRDLWGNARAHVLREAMLQWDLSVGCGACKWHLEHDRLDPDAAVYDRYQLDSMAPDGPRAMTFALSNRCNLGCVMCNSELSSTIRAKAGLSPLPSRYDDDFFADLEMFLAGLEYAKFLGGEPLLIPEHHRVWRLMSHLDHPPRLQITTNGTVWTGRVDWLMDRFEVDVTISIDAVTPAEYERIRVGASHANLLENVKRFHSICRSRGTELRFCFCLMADNWSELPEFLCWADSLDVPVSVNVVSDKGRALHDLGLESLTEVERKWNASPPPTGLNETVWQTQLAQLGAVTSERRAGSQPATRQAEPAPRGFLALTQAQQHMPKSSRGDARAQRALLSRWSEGRGVAELRLARDGRVARVVSPNDRLGVTAHLTGGNVADLVSVIEAADGRVAWQLNQDFVGSTCVRTFVLSTSRPVRGTPGAIVRTVTLRRRSTWTMLLAVDDIYDSNEHMSKRSSTTKVTIASHQPAPNVSTVEHDT